MRSKLMLIGAALLGLASSVPAQGLLGGLTGRHARHSRHAHEHVHHNHAPAHRHGYWTTVCEQVWLPGCYREEYVPPRYGWVYDACGRARWAMVEPGCTRRVWVPGRYETRTRRVWVPC